MKRTVLILLQLLFVALFSLSATFMVQAADDTHKKSYREKYSKNHKATVKTGVFTVNYDKQTDHLSVVAEAASLKSVLGRIAKLSSIEVLFDDKADESVSLDVKSESLEKGLEYILKGRNSAMRYSKNDKGVLLLIGVTVLPRGEQQRSWHAGHGGAAKRLVSRHLEAYNRAVSRLSREGQLQPTDNASERWQARLSEMSPELRKRIERNVNKRLLEKVESEQKQAEKRKKRKELRAKRKQQQLQAREEAMKAISPEQRARFEEEGAQARERMRVLLQETAQY